LVKGVAGADGQGRSVIAGPDDVEAAWQRAVAFGPAGAQHRVLAETVVEVESFVTLLAVRSDSPSGPPIEFCAPIGHRDADGEVLESWQPQNLSAPALDAAKSIAARVVKALGGRGVFGIELMINGDEVYFAGVTAGPRDSAWVTMCSQRLSVFELQARAILGLPVDTVMISPGAARVISPGHAPSSEALIRALSVPESDVQVFGPHRGTVALATGPDLATARDRARQVVSALNVPDSRG
jgi:phosphoribosylglycinamide formyltransferase 2